MSSRERPVHDALGREVHLAGTPRRIVSLVPSLTELLADLGLDEEVVGLTTFCVRPPGWKARKARVGGTKQVKREALAALAPELILANQEENTREDVEWLAARFPVWVTRVATLEEALGMLREVGALVGRLEAAEDLAREVERGFAALAAEGPLAGRRAAYLIWRRPWMVAGGDTFIGDLLRRAGVVNVFEDRPRYPEVDQASLCAARPELLLCSSEPFPFRPAHARELEAAVPGARALLTDGEAWSWYGSRLRHTPAHVRELARTLADLPGHPDPATL